MSQWKPTRSQIENLQNDRIAIEAMYEYRRQEEQEWLEGAKKWNMIATVTDSFYIPVTRMATYTGLVAMRQALPEIGIIPEDPDDNGKVDLLKDLNKHVDRQCGMEEVMDQVMVDYAVLGNGVIEDYVEYAYKKKRSKKLDKNGKWTGKWTEYYERDLSRPKVASRARSPWECAFEPGSRTVTNIRACTFQDKISMSEFKEIYAHGMSDIYMNTEFVNEGVVYTFDDGQVEAVNRQEDQKKIIIDHFQDERTDTYRIYANGILIQDESLSDFHIHGKITLSLIANHHSYDENLKAHRLYGIGDPALLNELDDLVNAVTNQFIKNYEQKNTYVIGVEGIGAIEDIDIEGNEVISGKVNVESLGAADLNEFAAFKDMAEEWAIQIVKKNYKRLEGEVAKTAYEAQQKKAAENMGMLFQIKRMENVGLKAHYQKRISDIMEYLTEEEIVDITDETAESIENIGWKDVPKENFVFDKDGKPVSIRYRTNFRTEGKVFEEKLIDGKHHIDGLRQVFEMDGQDGVITAHPEYLQTREWLMYRSVPEIYVVGASALGQDKLIDMANMERAFSIFAQTKQFDPEFNPNWQAFPEQSLNLLDLPRDEFLGETDEELAEDMEMINNMSNVLKQQSAGTSGAIESSLGGNIQGIPQGAQQNVAQPPQGITGGISEALNTLA